MGAEAHRTTGKSRGEMIGITVVLILIAVALAGLSSPVILRSCTASDRTEALNHIKQISTMLFEFDSEYGNFPDAETALEVKEATKTDFTLSGQYSNDYFRQLIADRKPGKSEKPFWAKTAQSPKKNINDDFSTAAKALAAGEVGFSYILASPTQGQSASGEPSRPVVVTPSYQCQPDWTFDPEIHGSKTVVLRLDNSATPMQIRDSDKKINIGTAGKTLGETGEGTVWGTDMNPTMKAPQPLHP